MTPNQLAAKLGGADNAEKLGKTFVRPYLRKHFARAPEAKGTTWELTPEAIKAVTTAYKARKA